MPIEIKELHVKVNVEQSGQESEQADCRRSPEDREHVIDACVEKVLEVLKIEDKR